MTTPFLDANFVLNAALLLMLLAIAIAVVRTRSLLAAILLMGVYSFIVAAWFMVMDAADVKSLQINVETHDGAVQLAGFVASAAMKDKAGRIAAGVAGVTSVDNVLVVRPR